MSNNEIRNNIYKIIEKYNGSGELDDCTGDIINFLNTVQNIKTFETFTDSDVFDSCGLDVFYISVSWVDANNKLNMCGSRLTSC